MRKKKSNNWKTKQFNKYSDMIISRGEDKTDEIVFLEYKAVDRKYDIMFANQNKHYKFPYNDIVKFENPQRKNIDDEDVFIGSNKVYGIKCLLDFGRKTRIVFRNGDYQTVDSEQVTVLEASNKKTNVENNMTCQKGVCDNKLKPYRYDLFPYKWQMEKLDKKIEECKGYYYSYEPQKRLEELIKYENHKAFVDIMNVGFIPIELSDYPTGNCHEISIRREDDSYYIVFFCYKKVIGIDLGINEIICSSGKRFVFPYIKSKDRKIIQDIKNQWKESVAIQLLLEYDILFLEKLDKTEDTYWGFEDMLNFINILKRKANLFNKEEVDDIYKKEIYSLETRYPSSQICHICSYKNVEIGENLEKREWKCPYCGTKHDRDINAAINILRKGMEERRY